MAEVRQAYIYSRVSKSIQAEEGKGLQRQEEKALDFIKTLNKSQIKNELPTYEAVDILITDRGLSAYLGKNTQKNAGLGAFIAAAEAGQIPAGSLLVSENTDRISRMSADESREIFRNFKQLKIDVALVKFGIIIYHDKDKELGIDLLLTAAFHLANMESQQKSQRIRDTFDIKRREEKAGGEKRTSICPSWLKLSADKKSFEVVKGYDQILTLIFNMKIDGYGSSRICAHLNESKIFSFTKKEDQTPKNWSKGMVEKYLKMVQVMGHFQAKRTTHVDGKRIDVPLGDVIKDYYPTVISEDTFIQVQQSFKKTQKGMVAKNFANLFSGICKCPTCGSTLSYGRSLRAQPKLRCKNKDDRRGCKQTNINYIPIEKTLIKQLAGLDYSKLNGRNFSDLVKDIDLLEHQIDKTEKIISNLNSALTSTSNTKRFAQLDEQIENKYTELEVLSEKRNSFISVRSNYDSTAVQQLNLTNKEDRQKYNVFIKQYINYIIPDDSKVIVSFKTLSKPLKFWYVDKNRPENGLSDKEIVKEIFTHGKTTADIKMPFRKDTRNSIINQLSPVLKPPTNMNDDLEFIKFRFEATRRIEENPEKWEWLLDDKDH